MSIVSSPRAKRGGGWSGVGKIGREVDRIRREEVGCRCVGGTGSEREVFRGVI